MKDALLGRLFLRWRERGDGRALAAVFDATAKELLGLAGHLVRDVAEAEDVVQATFVAALARAESYDGRSPLRGWLYGILWREAAKTRRRAARAVDPRRIGERVEPGPLDRLAADEVPAAVEQALALLPRRYAEVLRPLLFEEKSPARIASELERSPGTVRSQIHRGLELLRRRLAPSLAAPAAFALPTRGLSGVRAAVLEAAGASPSTAASTLTSFGLLTGGTIVSKTILAGAALAAVVLAGSWLVLSADPRAEPGDDAALAAAPAPREREAPDAPAVGPAGGDERDAASAPAEAAGETPAPERSLDEQVAYWRARFDEAPDDWRHGWNVAAEIAALPPDEALAIMTAVWPHLSVPVKEQALKPFVFHGGHPRALQVLHLAATDAAPSVQERAFLYLKSYAFRDFTLDYQAYLVWADRNRARPVGEVLVESARSFVDELLTLPSSELEDRVLALDRLDLSAGKKAGVDLAAELRAAGGERVIESALASGDPEVVRTALRWSKEMALGEQWLRTFVLPAIEGGERTDLDPWLQALGRPDCGWARDTVLALVRRATEAPVASTRAACMTLGDMGDPAAVPALIEILLADRTGELVYDVGHFGLSKLTGVRWQESYDGEWWLAWWERNRARFPAEVAATSIRR